MQKIIEKPAFILVGVTGRTSTANESSGNGIIGGLVSRYYMEQLYEKIPYQIEPGTAYSLYTEYASDKDGEYTFMMGAPVSDVGAIPPGTAVKNIPASRYAVLTSERGPMLEVIVKLWQRIWAMSDEELGGKRNYKANFEVYNMASGTPDNMQIDIYISID